jgi:hypothetical protein
MARWPRAIPHVFRMRPGHLHTSEPALDLVAPPAMRCATNRSTQRDQQPGECDPMQPSSSSAGDPHRFDEPNVSPFGLGQPFRSSRLRGPRRPPGLQQFLRQRERFVVSGHRARSAGSVSTSSRSAAAATGACSPWRSICATTRSRHSSSRTTVPAGTTAPLTTSSTRTGSVDVRQPCASN